MHRVEKRIQIVIFLITLKNAHRKKNLRTETADLKFLRENFIALTHTFKTE